MSSGDHNGGPESVWHAYGKRMAVCLALVAATPVAAQQADRVELLLSVIEAAGCVVTEANNIAILQAADMTEDEGAEIVMLLMSDGRAVPQDDDLRITTGACS